jgi:hypothetical protein
MIPTASEILLTIRVACEALTEIFKWLQTEDGKAAAKQAVADRAAFDRTIATIGAGAKDLFSGDLFKRLTEGKKP